ncbi:3133_t:CDS:2 [Cetraspora pellucida]|uniref:3133_t:CDS:1 n=1 Tax=Cetraspora pellucida TaxID=1433469 RepID=A0ACA9M6C9_9GLOM|nr:3133_t:CDS:2 [Cetraspora pellucida]
MGRIYKKYYSANATFLLDEVIQEIKGSIETKKRRSKSQTNSVLYNNELCSHISDSTPTNNSIEKISSKDLDALYEKEARRDEKNKANMTRLLATT